MLKDIAKACFRPALIVMFVGLASLGPKPGFAAIQDLVKIDITPCSGDGLMTLDTLSHRAWLNLRLSAALSYNDLTGPGYDCNPTCSTGPFAGWTLASEQDVIELLRDAGMSPYGDENFDTVYAFLNDVGWTYSGSLGRYGSYGGAVGLTRDVTDSSVHAMEASLRTQIGAKSAWTQQDRFSFGDTGSGGHGAWLYQVYPHSFPHAQFCASPTKGPAALTISFVDHSIKATSWLWDFGDHSTSSEQNPAHLYLNPGTYTVSLTVTGAEGSDTEVKTDLITLTIPDFSDAATSAVWANMYFCPSIANTWFAALATSPPPYFSYYGRKAYGYAEEAHGRAKLALDDDTTFWGRYAVQYAESDLNVRAQALTYSDMADRFAASGDYDVAKYYGVYALSLGAAADLYNGYVIWCSSMESSITASTREGAPANAASFSSAAQNAVFANIYSDTAVDYGLYLLNDPSFYPMVYLYASRAYDYAQEAYNDLQSAPVAEGDNATPWAGYAKQYAASEVTYRSQALSYFNRAVEAYRAGDLEAAAANRVEGYWRTAWADLYNGSVIWCAGMASKGGIQ